MLESFEVKNENGQEVLYCYLSYDYEFSKEFFSNMKDGKIGKQVEEWIRKNRIAFYGKKVVILASGIVIASLLLGDDQKPVSADPNLYMSSAITEQLTDNSFYDLIDKEVQIEEMQPDNEMNINVDIETTDTQETSHSVSSVEPTSESVSSTNETQQLPSESVPESPIQEQIIEHPITIYRSGVPVTLALEDYVTGVVAAEIPASFSLPALQAQAVLARTYALKYQSEGKRLTDTTDTQVYYDEGQLRNMWGSSFDFYYNKIKDAVQSTKGETLRYQGQYIDAVYHSTSNGKTEAARNVWGYEVPYLQSVDSSYDMNTTFYLKTEYKDMNQILQIFGITNLQEGDIEILSRNESGRVAEVRIQNQIYQGVDLRNLLGLSSADFDLHIENGNLVVTTRGWGHGVGMSQYGANGMANAGYSYHQILAHYYPGTVLSLS